MKNNQKFIDLRELTFVLKETDGLRITTNLHFFSVLGQRNSWRNNFEYMWVLIKLRFGRGMRPINEANKRGLRHILLHQVIEPCIGKKKSSQAGDWMTN